MNDFWKHFKSGTDIRGVALNGIPGEEQDLTDEVIAAMARAFILWLEKKTGKDASSISLAVGRDSRLSGENIASILEREFSEAGAFVYSSGLGSTPAMFMATLDLKLTASVQITASHHPWNRNGLKFFLPTGGLEGKDIGEILEICEAGAKLEKKLGGRIEKINYMDTYSAHLRDMIIAGMDAGEKPLAGFKVAVDAGNGAGGFYVEKVLKPLGADTSASQFLEPDGRFPNHIPNPENKDAMKACCDAVIRGKADLGIIFDTDVDRAGCVDKSGREINRNRLVALASVIALKGNEGGTIVTDSITSAGLKEFIENELGGKHLRFKRGYRNVINKSLELNEAGINSPLAIETSGHAALRENYFLDDGAYLATKILIEAARSQKEGKSLEALIAALREPKESIELRFKITDPDFKAYGENVIAALEAFGKANSWQIADDSYEGIRISFGEGAGNGWFLLRLSVHDPVMPLNIESDDIGGCKIIAQKLYSAISSNDKLDIAPLTEFLK